MTVSCRVGLGVLSLTTALLSPSPGWACDPPSPLPSVAYDWLPTCVLVRADDPQADSVIQAEAARLLGARAARGPFDDEQLHPLGFSAAGAFAWLEWRPDTEGLRWRVQIIDLQSDRQLAQLRETRPADAHDSGAAAGLAQVLVGQREAITGLLDQHGVVLQVLPVLPSSFRVAERDYRVRIEGGAVWLDAQGLGTKRLGEVEDWYPCAMCGTPDSRVVLSPWGDRAAVVVIFRRQRLEGAMPGVTHAVFGARLDGGFAAPGAP